jgi:uncharacterized protein YcaQ
MESLTAAQARSVALWRQGLLGETPKAGTATTQRRRVHDMVRHLGAVQLDTISTLARTHELVAYARYGAMDRTNIEAGYWNGDSSFEYWSHAACILPMESWPHFAFRRRHYVSRRQHWHLVKESGLKRVLTRLTAEGPVTTSDLGGAKSSSMWWDWSDSKIAVEWLLSIGTVVCTQRTGWRRVYDLAERAIPVELREQPGWRTTGGVLGPSDAECMTALVTQSLDVMGIGTLDDIADVHRLGKTPTKRVLADLGVEQVQVEGWDQPAYLSAAASTWLSRGARTTSPAASRTTLLSPFDSLIWHRPRTDRLFGMEHRLEAYTPAHKRVHGYFAMPVLHRGELVARVDPARDKTSGDVVLRAKRVTLQDTRASTIAGTAAALREAATWVKAESVMVDEVLPVSARRALVTAL